MQGDLIDWQKEYKEMMKWYNRASCRIMRIGDEDIGRSIDVNNEQVGIRLF